MKLILEITEADVRKLVHEKLSQIYPVEALHCFGDHQFEVKMTYRANETWRRPKYLRLHIEKRGLSL
jgi:hypothetical protein